GADSTDIDYIIEQEEKMLWEYIFSIAPQKSLFDVFLIFNDFHNIKTVLKGTIRSRKYSHALLYPSNLKEEDIKSAIEGKKFYMLPDGISDSAKEAYDILTKTGDVQLSDGVLDKACMEKQLELSKEIDSEILKSYFECFIFYNNMKIALRAAKAQKRSNFLDDTICEMDIINLTSLKNAVLSSQEAVLDYMARLNVYDSREISESFKKSPAEFEKVVDNKLMSIIKEGKYVSLGCEPVICFLLAKKRELLLIRIMAFGIRAKRPVEETRERLRMLYE
ncbi:MAG: V-type ATPase subunit, partial [Clostridia bacterium]|nr:V-type ATPase subunit [Clostridia bacterium]